ncbi:mechanosensitive ion channel family protein [Oceanithermus sp.]
MDAADFLRLQDAPLWIKYLVSLLALILAYYVGRSGARLFGWFARLTSDTRDDPFWRLLAMGWWVVVATALLAFVVYLHDVKLEPLHTWGSLLVRWLGSRGLGVLLILAGTYAAWRMVGVMAGRIKIADGGDFERQKVRKQTLLTVVESTAKGVVITVGALMVLANLGINVSALIAGAGIAGLAISFASQNLVRDVINGFFIILEDQYGVGDVIRVGDLAGGVERMNLRLTVLRDLEGKVHFVPNGQINRVTVMSRDWARAVVDVGVAYGVEVDRALEVIGDEAQKFYQDPEWRAKFTEPPQLLGVNELGDSAVVVRVMFSVKAKEQWGVAREFNRRIKNRLDAEGIEIPYPQRTVWLRQDGEAQA